MNCPVLSPDVFISLSAIGKYKMATMTRASKIFFQSSFLQLPLQIRYVAMIIGRVKKTRKCIWLAMPRPKTKTASQINFPFFVSLWLNFARPYREAKIQQGDAFGFQAKREFWI